MKENEVEDSSKKIEKWVSSMILSFSLSFEKAKLCYLYSHDVTDG